jgi:hypothetical protein
MRLPRDADVQRSVAKLSPKPQQLGLSVNALPA